EVTAVDLDSLPVGPRPREDPLRYTSIPGDEMTHLAEVGIREAGQHLRERLAHPLPSLVARAAGLSPGSGFEDTVVGHEGHQEIAVMAVPAAVKKRFQVFDPHHGLLAGFGDVRRGRNAAPVTAPDDQRRPGLGMASIPDTSGRAAVAPRCIGVAPGGPPYIHG